MVGSQPTCPMSWYGRSSRLGSVGDPPLARVRDGGGAALPLHDRGLRLRNPPRTSGVARPPGTARRQRPPPDCCPHREEKRLIAARPITSPSSRRGQSEEGRAREALRSGVSTGV